MSKSTNLHTSEYWHFQQMVLLVHYNCTQSLEKYGYMYIRMAKCITKDYSYKKYRHLNNTALNTIPAVLIGNKQH